jgi:AraC family transcriptional regulator, dual regulator of chb operon
MDVFHFTQDAVLDPVSQVHYNYITQVKSVTRLHDHDFCEVFLIAYGQVKHVVNGQIQELHEGSMMLMRPADIHCYQPMGDDGCGIMNLAFPTSVLQKALNLLYDDYRTCPLWTSQLPAHTVLPSGKVKEWIGAFSELNLLPVNDKEIIRRHVRRLLMLLLTTCFYHPIPIPKTKVPEWLYKLHAAMQEPEQFQAGLSVMIALCPTTPEHMYRQFHRFYHKTPSEFISDLRINYAANLLRNTDQPITQVALSSGFENLSYFYEQFKHRFGLTPARFRRENQTSAIIPEDIPPH